MLDTEAKNIIKDISSYFKRNKVCEGLIHFGSSLDSPNFHDIDLLCYIDNVSPNRNRKILSALYELQKKYTEYSFTYRENKVDKNSGEKAFFSFSLFGPKIKEYHVFKYGVKNNYKLLFGYDPINDSRKPTERECLKYMNLIYNINNGIIPQLNLKSILRSSLLIHDIYVSKEKLVSKFESLYNYSIPQNLKKLIEEDIEYTETNNVPRIVNDDLASLYEYICNYFSYKHDPKLFELTSYMDNDKLIKVNSETYRGIGKLLEKGSSKEEVLLFCNKQQDLFDDISKKS